MSKNKTGLDYLRQAIEELEQVSNDVSSDAIATHAYTLKTLEQEKNMDIGKLMKGLGGYMNILTEEIASTLPPGSVTAELKLILSRNCESNELDSLSEYINKELSSRSIGMLMGAGADHRSLIFNCDGQKKEDVEHYVKEVIEHNNFKIEVKFEWTNVI